LLSPADVREIAARLSVRPSKRLGQNFVVEQGTVRRIASLAALCPDDLVLEVGPGLGSLTLALLEAGPAGVIAVEIDPVLANELPRTIASRAPGLAGRVTVVNADALNVSETGLRELAGGPPTALVANLPYNVAVPVLLHLLAGVPSLARGLVMVQAEVADRMCAGPGSRVYGAPSVKLAWFAAARPAGPVPRTVFWPVPNVDSRLVAFTRHGPPDTAAGREEVFGRRESIRARGGNRSASGSSRAWRRRTDEDRARLGKTVIELEDVSVSVGADGHERALSVDNVTWPIGPGERVGIVGVNGQRQSVARTRLNGSSAARSYDAARRSHHGGPGECRVNSVVPQPSGTARRRRWCSLPRAQNRSRITSAALRAGDIAPTSSIWSRRMSAVRFWRWAPAWATSPNSSPAASST
jgi:16S rRNA (adenine1518-N6/adenine1519-N6)-dimethyltransferase